MKNSRWERRIERARGLARDVPAAAELLRFYAEAATFQRTVAEAHLPSLPLDSPELQKVLARYVPKLAELMRRVAPASVSQEEWFPHQLLLQAYAEGQAHRSGVVRTSVQAACPFCGEKPVVAVLRQEGDGGKRHLICALCLTEWEFRRLLCPQCGEEHQNRLPVFTAEQFPHVRIEACDTCHIYMKAIDLTKNGLAVPEVDELATVALDLWAEGKGYTKLQANLFGF